MSLVVCAACSRHVRRTETTCPFCDAAITNAIANAPERILPVARLSRAALIAFAAASVGAVACGGDTSSSNGEKQTVTDAAAGGATSTGAGGDVGIALYGAPFGGNVGAAGSFGNAYGAPFPPAQVDAGVADAAKGGAGGEGQAGAGGEHFGAGGSFHTLYGLPAP